MILDAIIIILREALEAGILISLLLSVIKLNKINSNWMWVGFGLGLLGACLYASYFSTVSEWFDYVGQEVVNASLQMLTCLCLLITALWLLKKEKKTLSISVILTTGIALSIIREGTEIIIFYTGILHSNNSLEKVLTSGFVGMIIGFSVGVIFYHLILLKRSYSKAIQIIFIVLVAAGLSLQSVQLLTQADWLPSSNTAWDSRFLLQEDSLTGQMAYAVLGYEATPSVFEVFTYFSIIFIFAILWLTLSKQTRHK